MPPFGECGQSTIVVTTSAVSVPHPLNCAMWPAVAWTDTWSTVSGHGILLQANLILEEAGGAMTDFHGTTPFLYGDRSDIMASNGHIHADLRFLI